MNLSSETLLASMEQMFDIAIKPKYLVVPKRIVTLVMWKPPLRKARSPRGRKAALKYSRPGLHFGCSSC